MLEKLHFKNVLTNYIDAILNGETKESLDKDFGPIIKKMSINQLEVLMFYEFIARDYPKLLERAVKGRQAADRQIDLMKEAWIERAALHHFSDKPLTGQQKPH